MTGQPARWGEAVCVVDFDVEEGPLLGFIHPPGVYPPSLLRELVGLAFPEAGGPGGAGGQVFYVFAVDQGVERIFCAAVCSQRKDAHSPRGYSQKSVVLLSKLRLHRLLLEIAKELSHAYWQEGARSEQLIADFDALRTSLYLLGDVREQPLTLALSKRELKLTKLSAQCREFLDDISPIPYPPFRTLLAVA